MTAFADWTSAEVAEELATLAMRLAEAHEPTFALLYEVEQIMREASVRLVDTVSSDSSFQKQFERGEIW